MTKFDRNKTKWETKSGNQYRKDKMSSDRLYPSCNSPIYDIYDKKPVCDVCFKAEKYSKRLLKNRKPLKSYAIRGTY